MGVSRKEKNDFFQAMAINKRTLTVYIGFILAVIFLSETIVKGEELSLSFPAGIQGFEKNMSVIAWVVRVIPFLTGLYFLSFFLERMFKGRFSSFMVRYRYKTAWNDMIQKTVLKTHLIFVSLLIVLSFVVALIFRGPTVFSREAAILTVLRLFEAMVTAQIFLCISFVTRQVIVSFWFMAGLYFLVIIPTIPKGYLFGLSSYFIQQDVFLEPKHLVWTAVIYLAAFVSAHFLYHSIARRKV